MASRVLIMAAAGTSCLEGRANVLRLVNAVRREAHGLDVADGYVDRQSPRLSEVVRSTVGPRVIVPLLPTRDRGALRAMTAAAGDDPTVTVTAPIGPDWVLAEIAVQRLMEVGARPGDVIVLGAEAAATTGAADDLAAAARMLGAVWGGRVAVTGTCGSERSLAEVVAAARARRRRVVLSSYALTSGAAHQALGEAGADVVTAPLLPSGPPDPRLVGLVLARARRAEPTSSL
ncbi:MAG: hypothetical protein QM621_00915 [Aeromicrobium sp.]|uniref:sirohydrochlorin chelatase n=1 Tax=Aeromicrobium sp. TaxID=1871063 RepID=UPI0039E72BA9